MFGSAYWWEGEMTKEKKSPEQKVELTRTGRGPLRFETRISHRGSELLSGAGIEGVFNAASPAAH